MARNGNDRGFFGWGSRRAEGLSSTDARPGSDFESPEYSRVYDHRSESEYSTLPNTDNQLRVAAIERENERDARRAAMDAKLAAQSAVHFFPSVGKFIIPEENTWAAHAEIVKDDRTNLRFNPQKFLFFDKIIAEKAGIPALADSSHPDFQKYEGLRTNLEVLRNDIIGIYLNDGSFDPGDEMHVPKIASIAEYIGGALANDKWYKRPFTDSISVGVANIEGVGAAEMYKHLLDQQTDYGALSTLVTNFKSVIGVPNKEWDLPPIETTPFSPAHLSAPPPPDKFCFSADELAQSCPTLHERVKDGEDPSRVRFTDRYAGPRSDAGWAKA